METCFIKGFCLCRIDAGHLKLFAYIIIKEQAKLPWQRSFSVEMLPPHPWPPPPPYPPHPTGEFDFNTEIQNFIEFFYPMSFNFNTELAFTPSYLELCIQQNGNCTIAQYISFKVQLFQWCAYKTMFFFLQMKKSSRKTFLLLFPPFTIVKKTLWLNAL